MSDLKTFKKGIKLRPEASAPTGSEGALYYKDNDGVYLHNGTSWVKISTVGGSSLTTHTIPAGSTTYTAGANSEDIILCQPSSSLTLTLPAASSNASKIFRILKINVSNTITIDTTGSDVVNGKSSISLTELNESVTVVSDGSTWRNINSEQVSVFDTIVTSSSSSTSLSNISYVTADHDFILTSATVGTLDVTDNAAGDLEIDVLKGANRGAATQSVFTTRPKITLTQEVSSVTAFDFSGTGAGSYFLIYAPDENFVVWMDKSGSDTDPTTLTGPGTISSTGATFTSIRINHSGSSGAASDTIANNIEGGISALSNGKLSTARSGSTVTITCKKAGAVTDIFLPDGSTEHTPPGGSAFTPPSSTAVNSASTSVQGVGGANIDSTNAILDGTHKIINKGDILKLSITSKPAGLPSCYIKIKGVK